MGRIAQEYIYEDKIVIFIDILGTKSLVEKTTKNDKSLTSLVSVLEGIPDLLRHIAKQHNELYEQFSFDDEESLNIQTSHFSDSYVISFSVTQDNLFHSSGLITSFLQALTEKFISLKVLLRGGVTYGKVIHTENVLFGPAMVEAYELESKYAKYPRIIFSHSIIKYISNCLTPIENVNTVRSIIGLKEDSDGFYYYNYIDVRYHSRYPAIMLNFLMFLLDTLNELNTPVLKEKYSWLRCKMIELSDQLGDNLRFWLDIEDAKISFPPHNKVALYDALAEYESTIEKLKQELWLSESGEESRSTEH